MQTANNRNDHVTMLIPNLSLVVFSFSVKLSSLALASKSSISVFIFSRNHKRESHVTILSKKK